MATQTITFDLPEPLYRSMHRLSAVTHQPIASIVQESLEHSLPPLDDLPEEEAAALAELSFREDAELWREARATLGTDTQVTLDHLLSLQGSRTLSAAEDARLQSLLGAYGRLTVRKAHAWLLLARRGYRVPPQGLEQE